MVTGALSAPGGIVSRAGPSATTPPAGPTVCLIIPTRTVEQESTPPFPPPPPPPPPPPFFDVADGWRTGAPSHPGAVASGPGGPVMPRSAQLTAAAVAATSSAANGRRSGFIVGRSGLVTGTHPATKQEAFRRPPLNSVRCSVRTCDSE